MGPFTKFKHETLKKFKECPMLQSLKVLRKARNNIQRTAQRCENNYWVNLGSEIQQAAYTGNKGEIYAGMRNAVSPAIGKMEPLRTNSCEMVTEKSKQLEM